MNEFQQKIIDLSITIGPILLLTIVAIIISRTLVFKSLMAFANTRVVRRSAALFDLNQKSYGEDFYNKS